MADDTGIGLGPSGGRRRPEHYKIYPLTRIWLLEHGVELQLSNPSREAL